MVYFGTMQLYLRNLIHQFYPPYHEVKLDRQGTFSSSAVVTCYRTFAAMIAREDRVNYQLR